MLRDFKHYKETGEVPDYFGRDVAYTQPEAAYKSCMMHIHLCFPPDSFPKNRVQYYRTCKSNSPENDACLVYVQGLLEENKYSLLAIMHPDVHGKARNPKIMSYLARIAQDFRDNN
ncbi:type II toxin-antitoxin system YafO family toxin [Photorhabdus antumapuensis]|uniref:type II toxin-antitoxin system YafO family toxin n=1 Tax=Photorhabdus antumapuensis TaxID=2862867 RepID=UPI00295ECF22|nr:type II toxin-antitoxin system YafO family toxin [Photorhabdus antumapuensis]